MDIMGRQPAESLIPANIDCTDSPGYTDSAHFSVKRHCERVVRFTITTNTKSVKHDAHRCPARVVFHLGRRRSGVPHSARSPVLCTPVI